MDNRLLSEQEMVEIDNRHTSPSSFGGVVLNMINARKECLTAQLTKTDKEWVEWVVIEATVISLGDEQGELANGDYVAIPVERWQQRRKEIGI